MGKNGNPDLVCEKNLLVRKGLSLINKTNMNFNCNDIRDSLGLWFVSVVLMFQW